MHGRKSGSRSVPFLEFLIYTREKEEKKIERRKWHMEAQSKKKDKTLKRQKWSQWNRNCISKLASSRAGAMRTGYSVIDSWIQLYIMFFLLFFVEIIRLYSESWDQQTRRLLCQTQNSIVIYVEMNAMLATWLKIKLKGFWWKLINHSTFNCQVIASHSQIKSILIIKWLNSVWIEDCWATIILLFINVSNEIEFIWLLAQEKNASSKQK